jgi:fatty acid desaturase
MEEKERNWKRETAGGVAAGSVVFLSAWLWGWPGLLAPYAILLLLALLVWICKNPLAALLLILLGIGN